MPETTEALTVYQIPASNMPGLMVRLDKLSRKSMKLLGKPVALNTIEEVRKPRMRKDNPRKPALDIDGNQLFDVFFNVTIQAETPKIAGWTFVATIDHSMEAGNIVRVNPNSGFEPDAKWRTVERRCDHCGKIRARRDTFLLRSDTTGEIKQIGRQCIRDFIGYDVAQVVAMAEIVGSAMPSDSDADMDWAGGIRDRRYIFVHTYMAHVAAMIRTNGWTSGKQSQIEATQSTASQAHTNMFTRRSRTFEPVELTDKDFETGDGALAWGKELAGKNDYEYNLSVVAKADMVEYRSIGILASMIPAYLRAKEEEFKQAERRKSLGVLNSKHVGTVGERLRNVDAILYALIQIPSDFGTRYLFKFLTTDGNVLIWFATEDAAVKYELGSMDAIARTPVRITGTVKKHDAYQGVNQTNLSRCAIEVVK